MLALSSASLGFAGAHAASASRVVAPKMDAATFKKFADSNVADTTLDKPWDSSEISDAAGLKELAMKLNPVVGYWGERLRPYILSPPQAAARALLSPLVDARKNAASPCCARPHKLSGIPWSI